MERILVRQYVVHIAIFHGAVTNWQRQHHLHRRYKLRDEGRKAGLPLRHLPVQQEVNVERYGGVPSHVLFGGRGRGDGDVVMGSDERVQVGEELAFGAVKGGQVMHAAVYLYQRGDVHANQLEKWKIIPCTAMTTLATRAAIESDP